MAKEFPLRLVISAVDRATKPLREVNEKIKAFTAPVRKLNNRLKALSDEAGVPRLAKSFKGVGTAIGKVGKEAFSLGTKFAAMATGAGLAMYGIVKGAVDAGDSLGEYSERVGLSADAYAQLRYAAAAADVEQEGFNSAMDVFNKQLGQAKAGQGAMLSFLEKVSPRLASQMKNATGTEEALGIMGKAFEKVTDPAKRAALAAAVFGKSGLAMGGFLGMGSAKIGELRKRFVELAGPQQALVDGAGAMDDAMRDVDVAFEGLRNTAAAALFPALSEVFKAVSAFIANNRDSVRQWAETTGAALMEWVKGGGIPRLIEGLKEFGQSVKTIADSLGGFQGTLKLVGLVMGGGLISSVLGLGKALWGLGAAVLPMLVRGFMLAMPIVSKLVWGIGSGLASAARLAGSALVSIAPAIGSALVAAAPFIAAAAGLAAAGVAIYKNWDQLKELFTDFTGPGGLLATLKEMFSDIANLSPGKWLETAGEFWGKTLGIGDNGAPRIGAAAAAPPAAGASSSQAHVVVDINGAPKGTRVSQTTSGPAELDTSLGYSMAVP